MEITDKIKEILKSAYGRHKKYREFWLSKMEYPKYWLTERKMRTIVNNLQKNWYIQKVRCENFIKDWPKRRNIFIATKKLIDLVQSFTKSIIDMNAKIIDWCKQNPVQKLRDMGIIVQNNGRIWNKKSKTTINKRNWAITNWKTWETWNLFNYLRDFVWWDTMYFFTHFVWN